MRRQGTWCHTKKAALFPVPVLALTKASFPIIKQYEDQSDHIAYQKHEKLQVGAKEYDKIISV